MKNCRTKLSWLVLALLLAFTGFARAQNPDPCDFQKEGTPEGCFEKAFSIFCGSFSGADVQVCEKTPPPEDKFKVKRGLRWLTLEEHCLTRQADQACTIFAKSKDHSAVRPAVLVYDHSNRVWRAYGSLDAERIERDVAGKPTVSLGRREELIVVVENTNPLLYTLTAGAATEVDIPELVEVKKLAALLGGNISSIVGTLNTEMAVRPAGDPNNPDLFMVLQQVLTGLQDASVNVSCSTARITDQTSRAGHFIQRLELGGTAEYPIELSRKNCANQAVADLVTQSDKDFENLARQLREARAPGDLCLSFLQAAEKAFGGDFSKGDDVRKAVLDAEAAAPTCTAEMRVVSAQLLVPLRAMQVAIEQRPQPADLAERLRTLAQPHLGETKKLVALITRYGEVHAGATTLLGKRDEVRKAATQVELFERRLRQHLLATLQNCSDTTLGRCVVAESVSRRLVLANEFKPVRWDKIQNHSLMLEANAPLASVVVPSRPAKSEAPYSLDSITRGLWGIAASVVTTRIDEPTFTAVSDGAEKPKFTITKTDKETRAGEVALLVDYGLGLALFPKKSTWVHGFGIEFGAGTDADQPAFFGGLSYRIGRFVRLGAGISYQQVTELEGQHEGQIVNSATDLRTRDHFTAKPYASFSVALEAFTLFSSGDE